MKSAKVVSVAHLLGFCDNFSPTFLPAWLGPVSTVLYVRRRSTPAEPEGMYVQPSGKEFMLASALA